MCESNHCLWNESKKRVKKRQQKYNRQTFWQVFKETIKVEDNKINTKSWNLTFNKLFCKRDSTRFISKYEFNYIKNIKSIIFNLSTKNIKLLWKFLILLRIFCSHRIHVFAYGVIFSHYYISKNLILLSDLNVYMSKILFHWHHSFFARFVISLKFTLKLWTNSLN